MMKNCTKPCELRKRVLDDYNDVDRGDGENKYTVALCEENSRLKLQIDQQAKYAELGRLVKGIRPEILWFAKQMEIKLTANDHKGGWNNSALEYLLSRATEELEELKEAIRLQMPNDKFTICNIIYESADVANIVLMIADICQKRAELLAEVQK